METPTNDIPGLRPTHDFIDEYTERAVYELAQCLGIDPFEIAGQLNIKLPRFKDKLFTMAFTGTPESRKPRVLEITPDEWLDALYLPEVIPAHHYGSKAISELGRISHITLKLQEKYCITLETVCKVCGGANGRHGIDCVNDL